MSIRILAALLIALAWIAAASAADPITIKFSHVVAPDTPKGKAAEYFKARAEELTGGRVRVEIYPNSTLYRDKEELEALQLDMVQMLAPSLAKFAPLGLHEFEVFDLPYVFDGYEDLRKVTGGPVGRQLLARLESRGIKGLAFWDNGFKSFSANSPIREPADLAGKRMRIQSSQVLEEQMRALGAHPRDMAFSEVYAALAKGIVDGTENPHSNLYTQKMHEVQKHLTLTDHGYLGYALIASKRFWESLPRDVRAQLERAVRESTAFANRIAKEENERALAAIREWGGTEVHVPTPAERAAFRQALLPVHKKMEARIGVGLLRDIYRETGFDPGRP